MDRQSVDRGAASEYEPSMSRYELYLFLHIVGAVVWVGGGTMGLILATRALRLDDAARAGSLMQDIGAVANRVFIPASLVVLVLGVLMVADGPWSFGSLWIVLGLAGYLATFLIGTLVLEPRANRIGAMLEGGAASPEQSVLEMRKFFVLVRVDTLVLFLVIADMALKPTGDDAGVLLGMAAVLVAGLAYAWVRLRTVGGTTAPATAAA